MGKAILIILSVILLLSLVLAEESHITLTTENNQSKITGKAIENNGFPLYYYLVPVIVTISFVFIFIILIIIGRMLVKEHKTKKRKSKLKPITGLITNMENITEAIEEGM